MKYHRPSSTQRLQDVDYEKNQNFRVLMFLHFINISYISVLCSFMKVKREEVSSNTKVQKKFVL